VHARRPDNAVLEISIYHNIDEEPAQEDDWELMVRLLRKGRLRSREAEVDDDAIAALEDVFGRDGIVLRRTERF
jgi:hypothetical protein